MDDEQEGQPPQDEPEVLITPFGVLGQADQIQKFMDQQSMIQTAFHSRVHNLFDSQTAENMATLRLLFNHIGAGGGRKLAVYFEGMASAMLRAKGVCPGCGEVHEGEGLDWLTGGLDDA